MYLNILINQHFKHDDDFLMYFNLVFQECLLFSNRIGENCPRGSEAEPINLQGREAMDFPQGEARRELGSWLPNSGITQGGSPGFNTPKYTRVLLSTNLQNMKDPQ